MLDTSHVQELRRGRRVSVFANNPVRRAIIRAAEGVSARLGMAARNSLKKEPPVVELGEPQP